MNEIAYKILTTHVIFHFSRPDVVLCGLDIVSFQTVGKKVRQTGCCLTSYRLQFEGSLGKLSMDMYRRHPVQTHPFFLQPKTDYCNGRI